MEKAKNVITPILRVLADIPYISLSDSEIEGSDRMAVIRHEAKVLSAHKYVTLQKLV